MKRTTTWILVGLVAATSVVGAVAQQPTAQKPGAAKPAAAAPAAAQTPATTAAPVVAQRQDTVVDAASNLIGRALFLRCFCSENTLSFDPQGHVQGEAKTTDWTLAAVNVQKVERKGPGEVELDGVRVAERFALDRREWDRHPMADEKMKIVVADSGNPAAFAKALQAIFSTGIDVALQRKMPAYWQHYFDPQTPWEQDAITGKMVYNPGVPTNGQNITVAAVEHKSEPGYTPEARRDRVTGFVEIRILVDTDGTPHRMIVVQPLGYGLEEQVIQAAAKYRFTPAKLGATPVVSSALLKQEFTLVDLPPH